MIDNQTQVFDVQFEINLLKRQVQILQQEVESLKRGRFDPWPTYGPIPGQTPPFCPSPIFPTDWLKPYSNCENKESKLD